LAEDPEFEGSLGTFGMPAGTDHARAVEHAFEAARWPDVPARVERGELVGEAERGGAGRGGHGAEQHHSTQQRDLAAGPHGPVIGRTDGVRQADRRVSDPAAYVRPSTSKRSPWRSHSPGMLAGSISSP
jgi:hypothetical protein